MTLIAAQTRHRDTGRNDACPCGSEKKYKKCHQVEDDAAISAELKRQTDAAEAEAAAKLAAEAEADAQDEKAGTSKHAAKKASNKVSQRRAKANEAAGGRSSQGDKSQSLPRRGAV